jgi:hypothetical protein
MEELTRKIAEGAKFLTGALARVSPLPEVLLDIIWNYMELWQILSYTGDLARAPIPDIMPSVEPNSLACTLNIFSMYNHTAYEMTRALRSYQYADQIRILNSITLASVIQIFHIKDPSIVKRLESLKRYPKNQRGKRTLAILQSAD